ncbi:MAG TPA: transcription antitermination factor NusB [Dehalococcoidia bacterium]|nr:transcription antitermination factor NusB [Dehalococcoidia bacterium]
MIGQRRKARTIAFQVLCEISAAGHDMDKALGHLLEESNLSEVNASFARELVSGAVKNQDEIDQHIRRFAPTWPIEQLPVVDKSILRLAIYEILLDNRVPTKVAINEAVELAKTFGSENSAKFVNGVLGAVSTLVNK